MDICGHFNARFLIQNILTSSKAPFYVARIESELVLIHFFRRQGWYIVTYALGIYHLNLLIGFLSPQIDPAFSEDFEGSHLSSKPRPDDIEPIAFKFAFVCILQTIKCPVFRRGKTKNSARSSGDCQNLNVGPLSLNRPCSHFSLHFSKYSIYPFSGPYCYYTSSFCLV